MTTTRIYTASNKNHKIGRTSRIFVHAVNDENEFFTYYTVIHNYRPAVGAALEINEIGRTAYLTEALEIAANEINRCETRHFSTKFAGYLHIEYFPVEQFWNYMAPRLRIK